MYESPIELITTTIMSEIAKHQEEQVMRAVQGVCVNVDKDELLKALAYDRQQYQKGYEDGLKNADIVHGRWVRDPLTGFTVCSYCGMPPPGDAELECFFESDYCPKCGALMDGDVDG